MIYVHVSSVVNKILTQCSPSNECEWCLDSASSGSSSSCRIGLQTRGQHARIQGEKLCCSFCRSLSPSVGCLQIGGSHPSGCICSLPSIILTELRPDLYQGWLDILSLHLSIESCFLLDNHCKVEQSKSSLRMCMLEMSRSTR